MTGPRKERSLSNEEIKVRFPSELYSELPGKARAQPTAAKGRCWLKEVRDRGTRTPSRSAERREREEHITHYVT